MPRKSRETRLQQTIDLISKYEEAGLGSDRVCVFARDMKYRLERKKALSPRRRAFLDSVIEQGIPEPKGDPEYIAKIDAAIATPGVENADVLREFRGKISRGWSLSEKQTNWCNALIKKAAEIRDGTYWRPDEEMTKRIETAVACYVCYSGSYWDSHPGGWRAMSKARQWLSEEVAIIDQYTVEKLFKTVAGKLREMENPRFQSGNICYYNNKPAIVLEGPVPTNRGIAYDILIEGNVVRTTSMSKRFRK